MKTYQDLIAVGKDEKARMTFVRAAIQDHKGSDAYKAASVAEKYYAKKNVTIEAFQKVLHTIHGQTVPDYFSANHKLKTGFFRRFVLQQVQYVMSNGVTFDDEKTKDALGLKFDNQLQKMAKKAMVDGVSFGFWNMDHLEVFCFADTPKEPGFAPLYDEDTGALRAGVRYWNTTNSETLRTTLYEEDGFTDYIERKGKDMEILHEKRPYKLNKQVRGDGEVEAVNGENYPGFPIMPMYANDLQETELNGIRESIDCYDFIKSGLANDIDDGSTFYWTLKNSGGMDDMDLQKFLERMRVVRAAVLDDEVEAEAHTLDIPTEARAKMLEILKEDLYEDFQIVNVRDLAAGAKTATEIRAAYQPMDDKCGDFEWCIREFLSSLFALTGIEDEPTFKWNRIANQTEETQMVLSAAPYLDDEAVLDKLPWISPEEADAILKRRDAEDSARLNAPPTEEPPIEEPAEE